LVIHRTKFGSACTLKSDGPGIVWENHYCLRFAHRERTGLFPESVGRLSLTDFYVLDGGQLIKLGAQPSESIRENGKSSGNPALVSPIFISTTNRIAASGVRNHMLTIICRPPDDKRVKKNLPQGVGSESTVEGPNAAGRRTAKEEPEESDCKEGPSRRNLHVHLPIWARRRRATLIPQLSMPSLFCVG
jgi:hypothetical protein